MDLVVIGYPDRLVEDHRALLDAARRAGFSAELVAPSRIGLYVDHHGERVLVDGVERRPDVVFPRGVNRPWPILRQVLEIWDRDGTLVVPVVAAADACADKLVTTRRLAAAGVPVLPTVGLAPGPGVHVGESWGSQALVAKPARASKARGVCGYEDSEAAQIALSELVPLVDGMTDHHVVQPLAASAGCDYRVVIAGGEVVALTRRHAPEGTFVTNRAGGIVTDVIHPDRAVPAVVDIAQAAAMALGLSVGGIDVIEHVDGPVVLEANAWPGLAASVHGDRIAAAFIDVARSALGERHLVADLLGSRAG
jgi:glutathione synthase/RimK-type ligase-like ATP-grasp enzyme